MSDANDPSSQARQHHYLFAHLALRGLVEAAPMHVFAQLMGTEGQKFLLDTWNRVGQEFSPEQRVSSEGLSFSLHKLSDERPMILVKLPEAKQVAEAHFVAIVLEPPGRKWLIFKKRTRIRYFTLEAGESAHGKARTILCEWRQETHLNYGDGPAVDEAAFLEAAFLEAVVDCLSGRTKLLGSSQPHSGGKQ